VSALLGITEPALFGVNLKYKFPFFCALIGSGVAAALAGFMHVIAVSLGSAGFLGFLSINATSIPAYLLCEVVSFAVAFSLTYLYGKKNSAKMAVIDGVSAPVSDDIAPTTIVNDGDEIVAAPVSGVATDLSDVNDAVFSSKLMGDGGAIVPTENNIYAPITGTLTVVYETNHAYGIKGDNGIEVLIHLGIDTVNLKGQFFETNVTQGQHINVGDQLGSFDINKVAAADYDTTVITAITNTTDFNNVARLVNGDIEHGEQFVIVTP
jgi:PTS system sucrose-specific IIC component